MSNVITMTQFMSHISWGNKVPMTCDAIFSSTPHSQKLPPSDFIV